jgi:hypothetical protein
MIFRSWLPVVLMSAVALITLGLWAPWGAAKAFADPSGDRIGCGTYCQNAGGYGAPGSTAPPAATLLSNGTVTADSDGYVPVTVKCNLSAQCSGALLVCLESQAAIADPTVGGLGMAGMCGRSDLRVDAGATRTIGVPLPAPALPFLRSHGPTTSSVTADSSQSSGGGAGFKTLSETTLTAAAPG